LSVEAQNTETEGCAEAKEGDLQCVLRRTDCSQGNWFGDEETGIRLGEWWRRSRWAHRLLQLSLGASIWCASRRFTTLRRCCCCCSTWSLLSPLQWTLNAGPPPTRADGLNVDSKGRFRRPHLRPGLAAVITFSNLPLRNGWLSLGRYSSDHVLWLNSLQVSFGPANSAGSGPSHTSARRSSSSSASSSRYLLRTLPTIDT
ncbi:hypothetical protein CMEL01_16275, partial [Colletotrichum melonis]